MPDKDPCWFFSCFFFSLPLPSLPFLHSQLLLTFICTLYPAAHTLSHTHSAQLRERALCVLETKAPLSLEWELSFRLKLTVSEGRGRADDGPRIRYATKCVCMNVCVNLHLFIYLCFDSMCKVCEREYGCLTLNPLLQLCLAISFSGAFPPSVCMCVCMNVCVVRVVRRLGEGTEFVSAWCEPVNRPPADRVRLIGRQGAMGASSVLTI